MKPHEARAKNLRQLIDDRYAGKSGRLADAMGKKRPMIYRLFSNAESARDIGEELAREIEAFHGLPMGWLDKSHGKKAGRESLSGAGSPFPPPRSRLPLISWVAAGGKRDAIDPYSPGQAETWVGFEGDASSEAFCLQVRGDSMVRPDGSGFPSGCIIAIEPRRAARSGDFVVVRFNDTDEATFKQFFIDGPLRLLKPLNPSYPMMHCTPDSQIVGVVFEKRITEKF
jgi:SOS-response transcriptional repressor LexA